MNASLQKHVQNSYRYIKSSEWAFSRSHTWDVRIQWICRIISQSVVVEYLLAVWAHLAMECWFGGKATMVITLSWYTLYLMHFHNQHLFAFVFWLSQLSGKVFHCHFAPLQSHFLFAYSRDRFVQGCLHYLSTSLLEQTPWNFKPYRIHYRTVT